MSALTHQRLYISKLPLQSAIIFYMKLFFIVDRDFVKLDSGRFV